MANDHGDFIWYELLTGDADAASAFYGALLGWQVHDSGMPDMDYRLAESPGGETVAGMMTLTDEMKAGGAQPCWLGYIGVQDVDASVAAMTADGATVRMPAFDVPGVGRMAMLTDPQGVPFYVMRGASDETSYAFAFDRPRPGHVAWNELSTTDPAGAMSFYTRHFGWVQDGAMDMGPMGQYQFLRDAAGKGVLGALMPKMPEMPVPFWTFYFRVPSIDAAAGQIPALGGQITHGPSEVPGEDWIINGIDPTGAHFALVGAKS